MGPTEVLSEWQVVAWSLVALSEGETTLVRMALLGGEATLGAALTASEAGSELSRSEFGVGGGALGIEEPG